MFVGRSCAGGSPRISLLITPTGNPNHRVLEGFLDDDSSGFAPGSAGCAYYDLVSVGARTYTNHTDADGGGPGAKTNSCPGS